MENQTYYNKINQKINMQGDLTETMDNLFQTQQLIWDIKKIKNDILKNHYSKIIAIALDTSKTTIKNLFENFTDNKDFEQDFQKIFLFTINNFSTVDTNNEFVISDTVFSSADELGLNLDNLSTFDNTSRKRKFTYINMIILISILLMIINISENELLSIESKIENIMPPQKFIEYKKIQKLSEQIIAGIFREVSGKKPKMFSFM